MLELIKVKEIGWVIDWARRPNRITAAHETFFYNLNAFDVDTGRDKSEGGGLVD